MITREKMLWEIEYSYSVPDKQNYEQMATETVVEKIVNPLYDELEGANALISAIEHLYPDWRKFRDLAEAVQFHNESRDKRLKALQGRVDELMEKLYPKHKEIADVLFEYLAVVTGGIGPDVWDKEIAVHAKDIGEAVRIIEGDIKDSSAAIVSIEQVN